MSPLGKTLAALRRPRRSPLTLGIVAILVVAVIGVLIFFRHRMVVTLEPGDTITIHFSQNYGVTAYSTAVKVAGVQVGEAIGVGPDPGGGAVVTVKVSTDVPGRLRSAPTALIRPTTLLGGNYYIDMEPGGGPGPFTGDVPRGRTTVPVELDQIARSLQPNTLTSLQGTVGELNGTLDQSGQAAIQQLLADAPGALGPAAGVLQAARGTQPATDLPQLVRGLESTGYVLSQQQGQLAAIVSNLDATSQVLGQRAGDLRRTLAALPGTLDSTNAGLSQLDVALLKLRDTADPARPVAQQLNTTLQQLNPVLVKANPLVVNLNALLSNAQPLVDQLTPTAQGATTVLNNLNGPVLNRINGPIMTDLRSPWHGTGHYLNSGGNEPMYQAIAYAFTGIDGAFATTDKNGAALNYAVGASAGTVGGLPISLEQLLGALTGISAKGNQ